MPEQLTPELRTLRAQIAAHESWAHTENRAARTANARKAALQCFEDQVDPDGKLTPAERTRRNNGGIFQPKFQFQRFA